MKKNKKAVYNTRNFRANLKEVFDEVEQGKEVIVSNGQRAFKIVCVRKSLECE